MTRNFAFATLAALVLPGAAMALPAVGDQLGTDAETVRTALADHGCPVTGFEAEDGMIEAQCTDTATNLPWEFYIDPKTGTVTNIKQED